MNLRQVQLFLSPLVLAIMVSNCAEPQSPDEGVIHIQVVTIGDELDTDGYRLTLEGQSLAVGVNATIPRVELAAGEYHIQLDGVARNCTVVGMNPQIVSVSSRKIVNLTFTVTCAATGSVRVRVRTTGTELDPDGYGIRIDNDAPVPIGPNDSLTVTRLPVGRHGVALNGVRENCVVETVQPAEVIVAGGMTTETVFEVRCASVGQLAFASPSSGNSEIYLINLSSGVITQLTFNKASDTDPAWSPDGNKIAFASNRNGKSEIYTMNADGSNVVRLTDMDGYNSDPEWSPDGMRIAFTSTRSGHAELLAMNADGSSVLPLSRIVYSGAQPAWSPDGRIAFASYREIYVMNADGNDVRTVTHNQVEKSDPAWSPTGKLVYRQTVACNTDMGCISDLFLLDVDTGVETRLPTDWSDHTTFAAPAWSPDGSRIVFTETHCGPILAYGDQECRGGLRILALSGSLRSITVERWAYGPKWRPQH